MTEKDNTACAYVEDQGSYRETRCQFEGEPVTKFDGSRWCQFHLPLESFDGVHRSAKANWSGEQVQSFDKAVKKIIDESLANGTEANLRGVVFPTHVDFTKQTFPKVDFDYARFPGGANFQSVTFSAMASFKSTNFHGQAMFQYSQFMSHAAFKSAHFHDDAFFHEARVQGVIDFEKVIFGRYAFFEAATFKDAALFESVVFERDATFDRCGFDVPMSLSGAKFEGDVSFSYSRFGRPLWIFGGFVRGDSQANSFRMIKKMMSDIHHVTEQGRFFALEQRAMLFTNTFESRNPLQLVRALFDKLISAGYWLISDYGFSPTRSVIAFVIVFAIWAGLVYPAHEATSAGTYDTVRFTFLQILRPFQVLISSDITRDAFPWMQTALANHPISLRTFAALQSALHLTIFALFLLAVRRRFKM